MESFGYVSVIALFSYTFLMLIFLAAKKSSDSSLFISHVPHDLLERRFDAHAFSGVAFLQILVSCVD